MSAAHKSKVFSRVHITHADIVGLHEVLLQIYYKNYIFSETERKDKQNHFVSCFSEMDSTIFLLLIGQELRLSLVHSTVQ